MNVKLPLGILLVVAAVLGYVLGTESGRQQRDGLLRKLRREEEEDIEELIETVDDVVAEVAESEVAESEVATNEA